MFWFFTLVFGIVINISFRNEKKSTQCVAKGICALIYAVLVYLFMGEEIADCRELMGSNYGERIMVARYGNYGSITYVLAGYFLVLEAIGCISCIPAYFFYRNKEEAQETNTQMIEAIESLKKEIKGEKEPAPKPEEKLPTWKRIELERAAKQAAPPKCIVQADSNNKIKCPKCGNVQSASLACCFFCGTQFTVEAPSQKCCSKCGAELMENAVFCSKCGEKQDQEQLS